MTIDRAVVALALTAVAGWLSATTVLAQLAADPTSVRIAEIIKDTWKSPAPGWQSRIEQDETQRVCSESRNNPKGAARDAILARERATITYPADGNVLGSWKAGEVVAETGTGGQFTDKPDAPNGGNCYACHQMAAKQLSYGTLGPSFLEYGKVRRYAAADARATYAKIFNAQAVLPCSQMPRFGYHRFLTEQQLKDVTAYLFDPDSPVNKP